MDSGNPDTLSVAIVRTFLLAGKLSLLSGELTHRLLQILRVIDNIAVAVGVKLLYADINANHAACIWPEFRLKVNIQNDKVFTRRSALYRDMIDMPYFHGLSDFDIPELRELQVFPGNVDIVPLIDGPVGLTGIMLAFEDGMLRLLLEHVYKRPVKIPEGLLQCDRINVLQESKVSLLFKVCEHGRCLAIANLFAIGTGTVTHGKTFVVDEPAASECSIY